MKVFLARHGEAVDDIEDCYGGIADFPLTDRGREQARALAELLAGRGIQRVFSSPLARARETAELVADTLGLRSHLSVVPALQERNSYGVLSGVNKDRAKTLFRAVLQDLKEKPGYSREPLVGAEDFDAFVTRARQALDEVLRQAITAGAECILIVSHGKLTRALCEEVLRVDFAGELPLGRVLQVDYSPSRARVGEVLGGS